MTPETSSIPPPGAQSQVLALLAPMLRSAVAMARDGDATAEAIDTAMRLGARHPTGPLEFIRSLDADARATLGVAPLSDEAVSSSAPEPDLPATAEAWSGAPVGVVGSGFMATGIAYAVVVSGQEVRLLARTSTAADGATRSIEGALAKASARGRLDEREARVAAARVRTVTDPSALQACDLVIEAVAEDLAVKRTVFAELDAVLPRAELLATNTSSLRVQDIASATRRPERIGALHFFSPVAAMRLVEVAGSPELSEDQMARGSAWARSLGKVPVRCADRAGFIVNSLLIPFLNDVVRSHEHGAGSLEELDDLLTGQAGHPMGPFALLDFIGLDVSLAAQESIYAAGDDGRLRPADLLVEHVRRGDLGRKTGRGFYDYAKDGVAAR